MSKPVKIDLSAIMNKRTNETEKTKKEEKKEEVQDSTLIEESSKSTENITISSNTSKNIISTENSKNNDSTAESKNNIDKVEQTKNQTNIKKEDKEKILEKCNKELEKIGANEKCEIKDTNNNEAEKNGEIFGNYKSDFAHKEEKILKKVIDHNKTMAEKKQKLRDKLREPKTRIALVFGLIILTTSFISALFILDPERHSLTNYKTSILGNFQTKDKLIISDNNINQEIEISTGTLLDEITNTGVILEAVANTGVILDTKIDIINANDEKIKKTKNEVIKNVLLEKFKQ